MIKNIENSVSSEPLVSVVMSAYNEEFSVAEAIESILLQTYKNIEFIIVNDGSTDSTHNIIDEYSKREECIQFINNEENFGLAASLNKAISVTKGEFIARMDADDYSLPERIEKQISFFMINRDISVLGGGAKYIDRNGINERTVMMPENHSDIVCYIPKSSPFIHPTVMMRRSFIERTGEYNRKLRTAEDYELWVRGLKTSRYHNMQEPLIEYTEQPRATRQISSILGDSIIRLRLGLNNGFFIKALFWFVVLVIHSISFHCKTYIKER